jgi:hypothetical protein
MKTAARRVLVRESADRIAGLELARGDLMAAGVIEQLDTVEGEYVVEVELADTLPQGAA